MGMHPILHALHITINLVNTYDFSSCFFPKFKKSTKRGFSPDVT